MPLVGIRHEALKAANAARQKAEPCRQSHNVRFRGLGYQGFSLRLKVSVIEISGFTVQGLGFWVAGLRFCMGLDHML